MLTTKRSSFFEVVFLFFVFEGRGEGGKNALTPAASIGGGLFVQKYWAEEFFAGNVLFSFLGFFQLLFHPYTCDRCLVLNPIKKSYIDRSSSQCPMFTKQRPSLDDATKVMSISTKQHI